jgi:ribonuclease R
MSKERKKVLMDIISSKEYKPLKLKGFKILLGLENEEVEELEALLKELVTEGKLILTNKKKYILNEDTNYLVGTFVSHQKGFGFVEVEDREDDIFIPADFTKDAFHGDTVSVNIKTEKSGDRREEGEIVQVLKRGIDTVIGTFQKSQNFGFVVPDHKKLNKDIFIQNGKTNGAVNGHKVVVKILNWGGEGKNPEGVIISIIGHINDPETEIKSIILAYGIPVDFPEEVMEEIKAVPDKITQDMIHEESHREDLRGEMTVTIDGKDAKDLDDAITLKKISNGFELGVHIADVTHYVGEGTALDQEALLRGTSVYLVDRVIPMLPHRLSNGICSLNAGEDRFALSCIMEIDMKGKVRKHRVVESILNINERMNYDDVKQILVDHDEELMKRYHEQMDMFKTMEDLQSILKERRRQRGSIEFDFPEAKFKLDDKGRIIDIYAYERSVATKVIEEFMLLANETIAEEFHWQEIPFLYRSHEDPDPEKIRNLTEFIRNYGYKLKGKELEPHPKEIQKLLVEIEGSEQETIISRLALRSMKQAKYTTTSDGHFGLATDYYTHFTSPIRRYPDLQIHRIIKDVINGRLNDRRYEHYEDIMDKVAADTSRLERRAEEVEREVAKFKKAEYMEDKIGQMYRGVISGLTNWGIYVELPNTIEGLIPMNRLTDDYYNYDEKHMTLIGERTGRIFRLGEAVTVEVLSVDKRMRTIDFGIIYEDFDDEE